MFQVRIHGRGGQGVVTAAELLSVAAFREGKYAQAFPSFGSERMGAPIVAFCRIHDSDIRTREPIAQPDALVVQDPTLLHSVDVFNGLEPDGYVLLNSSRDPASMGLEEVVRGLPEDHVITVPATELALERVGRPIPNAALLGAFAALTGQIGLPAVSEAIREKFPGVTGEKNVAAAGAAYQSVAAGRLQEVAPC